MTYCDKHLVFWTCFLAGASVAFCAVFVIPWRDIQEKSLSVRTRLTEKRWMIRYPPPLLVPANPVLVEQALEFEGKKVWSTTREPWGFGEGFHVSPGERYIVIEHWLREKPISVLRLEADGVGRSKTVTVEAPSIEGHYYSYPFKFVEWSKSSESFTVEAAGRCVKSPDQSIEYRELWEVQADTGATKRLWRHENLEGQD